MNRNVRLGPWYFTAVYSIGTILCTVSSSCSSCATCLDRSGVQETRDQVDFPAYVDSVYLNAPDHVELVRGPVGLRWATSSTYLDPN